MSVTLIDRNICVSGTMAEEVDSSAPSSLKEDTDKNNGEINENNGDIDENNGEIDENNGEINENSGEIYENNRELNENNVEIDENNGEINENNREIDENSSVNSKFDQLLECVLQDLKEFSERSSELSTLEILLALFNIYLDIPHECRCFIPKLFDPYNINFLIEFFTLMKDIIEFTSNKISENLVKDLILDFKSEYQLHLLHLLQISFGEIDNFINSQRDSLDEFDQIMDDELVATLNQINDRIAILISRHGWHYREEMQHLMQQRSRTSRARPYSQRPFQHKIFNYYENCAGVGIFPHIFWQGTPLREKISQYDTLELIFSNGKEEMCCICMTDEESLKNNFAIFLECNHIVCTSCAERLLVDDTKTR